MTITIIAAGCGSAALTAQAQKALAEAELVVGAKRLLDDLSPACKTIPEISSERIAGILSKADCENACVLLSGDTGFYSGARRLLPLLEGHDVRVLPGVSSVQALSARLGRPWQDWMLCSAHGVDFDVRRAVCGGKPVFVLTSGANTPAALCRELADAGLGALTVTVAENLGYETERIVSAPALELAAQTFAPLNVMLIEAAPYFPPRAPGWPDEAFSRAEGVPMTKQLVRAAAISALGAAPEDVCWDVGAGTGSVSVELSKVARAVYAAERDRAALDAAKQNREKFCAWNLRLIEGEAPDALRDLPAPDKVFLGGTGGKLRDILQLVHEKNPKAIVCATAITIETLSQAVSEMESLGWRTEITQLAVSRSRRTGAGHMMLAQNPVYLIVGEGE